MEQILLAFIRVGKGGNALVMHLTSPPSSCQLSTRKNDLCRSKLEAPPSLHPWVSNHWGHV
jgi:hypothetical protein